MLEEARSLNFFFSVPRVIRSRGTTCKYEHLSEFEIKFENIIMRESGSYMGQIHDKNQIIKKT